MCSFYVIPSGFACVNLFIRRFNVTVIVLPWVVFSTEIIWDKHQISFPTSSLQYVVMFTSFASFPCLFIFFLSSVRVLLCPTYKIMKSVGVNIAGPSLYIRLSCYSVTKFEITITSVRYSFQYVVHVKRPSMAVLSRLVCFFLNQENPN